MDGRRRVAAASPWLCGTGSGLQANSFASYPEPVTLKRLVARDLNFDGIRTEFGLPAEFSPEAQRDAAQAVDRYRAARVDRTDLELVTIDPPGSRDLDQALRLERTADGYLLHYAIADVAAQIEPGSTLDIEARERGETIYLPDGSVPLHPLVFSEGSASLLPHEIRPAALWRIETDHDANPVAWTVQRTLVKSVRQLTYREAQDAAAAGNPHPAVAVLPEFGRKRRDLGLARGAIELNLPEQDVVRGAGGDWELVIEARTETDGWNAQISLLTGICAARIMLDGGIGMLRTLPPADGDVRRWMRRTAEALGVPWTNDTPIGEQLAALDPCATTTLAMMTQATTLLRGASYLVFDGVRPDEQAAQHAGIAAPYAHVTAPLRRLGTGLSPKSAWHCPPAPGAAMGPRGPGRHSIVLAEIEHVGQQGGAGVPGSRRGPHPGPATGADLRLGGAARRREEAGCGGFRERSADSCPVRGQSARRSARQTHPA